MPRYPVFIDDVVFAAVFRWMTRQLSDQIPQFTKWVIIGITLTQYSKRYCGTNPYLSVS
jgi:hypothetical protein